MAFHRKARTVGSYDPLEFAYSIPSDSQTVPNDALSARELLMRFKKGLPPEGTERYVEYDEEDDFNINPSVRQNADLTDSEDFREEFHTLLRDEVTKSRNRSKARAQGSRGTSQKNGEPPRPSGEGARAAKEDESA
ncbi:hypothetical protein [Dipodfec virus UOA04_Rod_931]|nr:hypothetical protein [Dipodfec virus UOA04_Rod_931]